MQLLVIHTCSAWVHRTRLITIYKYDYQHKLYCADNQKNFSTSGGSLRPEARGIFHICHMVNPALDHTVLPATLAFTSTHFTVLQKIEG